jgi:hypothetical protein
MTLNNDRTKMIYRERKTRRLYFDHVFDFSIHHFYQVLDFFHQKIVFEFYHIDEKIFLHVIKCMRKRHLSMIVKIIKSDVMIEINQKKKTMMSRFKKRWCFISKSDDVSFQKSMMSHFKKRWVREKNRLTAMSRLITASKLTSRIE